MVELECHFMKVYLKYREQPICKKFVSLSSNIYCEKKTYNRQINLRIFGSILIDNNWARHPDKKGFSYIIFLFLTPNICCGYSKNCHIMGGGVLISTLTLNAPISTKVVCFSRLLKCLRSLYGKQCGPRSDCSYRSSLFWVHTVCFYT